jgi:hypothetical protein
MKLSLRPKRSRGPETYAEAEALAVQADEGADGAEEKPRRPTVGKDPVTGRWTKLDPERM